MATAGASRGAVQVTYDTRKGERKLRTLRQALPLAFRDIFRRIGSGVAGIACAKFAPSRQEEKDILVRGKVVEPWSGQYGRAGSATAWKAVLSGPGQTIFGTSFGAEVGTDAQGRFVKLAGQMYLRDALLRQRARVTPAAFGGGGGFALRFRWGRWSDLKNKTAFSYYRHPRGNRTEGPFVTYPFDHDWPRKANFGGSWMVVPRNDRMKGHFEPPLAPEPYKYASKMLKTVKPYRYAQKGRDEVMRWWRTSGINMAAGRALIQSGLFTGGKS